LISICGDEKLGGNLEKKFPRWIERVVAVATEGIVVLDSQKKYVFANSAAEKILGVSRKVILGRDFEQSEWNLSSVKGTLLIDDENPFTQVIEHHKSVYGMKFAIERSDGKKIIIAVNASPLIDKAGELEGMVGIFSDVTEEFELQERNRYFLHTIAHDLRAPLSVVLGYAEMLEESCVESCVDGNMNVFIKGIVESAEKMVAMIEDLVDDARIAGGTVFLALERIVLKSYVQSLLKGNRSIIDGTRIETKIPERLSPVSADPRKLERIILNLVDNALKFSPPKSKILIDARETSDGEVIISISDHGKGLSKEDSVRIFRRFYQADTTKKPGGVGLGLYISRSLVEAHGGLIWVESIVGKGSSFRFTLPVFKEGFKTCQ
jgi:PAS domain S-box-containing protein